MNLDFEWEKLKENWRRALHHRLNERPILLNQPLMIDEAGGGDDLPVADQRGVLLRSSVGAENVARVN